MIRDLELLPQDAAQYCPAGQLSTPLLSLDAQQTLFARLRERFFTPWNAAGQSAITVAHTSLREEPTPEPRYSDPAQPGGGPPFDQLQITTLWPGTPLRIIDRRADWARVSSPLGDGWMPQANLATVDAAFIAKWMQTPPAVITEENVELFPDATTGAPPGATLKSAAADCCSRLRVSEPHDCTLKHNDNNVLEGGTQNKTVLGIGAILPVAEAADSEIHLLVPVSNSGLAEIAELSVASSRACLLPMAMTVSNLARLANQMLGQPYGWGGVDALGKPGLRDCSSTTHDLFAPFGLWLPRNSIDQATAGRAIALAGMSNADKERTILRHGKPWLTLLRSPGHIMLYIGSRDGRAAILHNFWAVRTSSSHVVARCCITTLSPGAELPDLLPRGTYLDMLESMVILP